MTETGEFIGFTGLAPMPDDVPGASGTEIGWRLARPAWHPRIPDGNEERQRRGLTWAGLAERIGCTSSRLTNLRTARQADMALVMRVTQWLRRPAAEFIHPASSRHRADLL